MSHHTNLHIKAASSDGFKLPNNLEQTKNKSLEKWVEELAQYERMLEGMTKANLATNFKEELGAVENWFDALEEGERTASLYSMVHKCSPVLVRFLITVLQKIAKTQSLEQNQGLPTFSDCFRSFSNTSVVPMLKHSNSDYSSSSSSGSSNCSPTDVPNVLPEDWRAARSLSKTNIKSVTPGKFKANSLDIKAAVHWGQREMSNRMDSNPPAAALNQESPWRSKSYSKSLKSPSFPPGLNSITSPTWTSTPTDSSNSSPSSFPTEKPMDPVDFNLLNDIPQWMRSLRLHKYTTLFEKLNWQEIIILTDDKLTTMGVAALGARRKFLKVFDHVKKEAKLKGIVVDSPSDPGSPLSDSHSESIMEGLNHIINLTDDIKA